MYRYIQRTRWCNVDVPLNCTTYRTITTGITQDVLILYPSVSRATVSQYPALPRSIYIYTYIGTVHYRHSSSNSRYPPPLTNIQCSSGHRLDRLHRIYMFYCDCPAMVMLVSILPDAYLWPTDLVG